MTYIWSAVVVLCCVTLSVGGEIFKLTREKDLKYWMSHKTFENTVLRWEARKSFSLDVTLTDVVNEVDRRFLSVAIESRIVNKLDKFNISDPALLTLSAALSPAYLRMGGTSADFLIVEPNITEGMKVSAEDVSMDQNEDTWNDMYLYDSCQDPHLWSNNNFTNFSMSAESWDQLNTYTQTAGWELLFDLNVLLRRGDDWDTRNTTHLLDYSVKRGYNQHLHFELGNEPDAFRHAVNRSVDAKQLGKDFLVLHDMIRNNPKYAHKFRNSLLVGPDLTKPKKSSLKYLKRYLKQVKHRIDRITFHHYYCNGRNTSQAQFLDPQTLDVFPLQISSIRTALQEVGYGNATLWLGETSSCYGGGAPGLSDAYIAGFLWLDKLGMAAKHDIDVVVRQTLYGGRYSLLSKHLEPLPDYWLSLLHKVLVGQKVLDVQMEDETRQLRMYAHCTNNNRSPFLADQYTNGSVTMFGLNLFDTEVDLTFNSPLLDLDKHVYWLTPHGHSGLLSQMVSLNKKKLKMPDATTMPVFHPVVVPGHSPVTLPAQSFGFVVIPNARARVCMG